jgi:hypothetical protein
MKGLHYGFPSTVLTRAILRHCFRLRGIVRRIFHDNTLSSRNQRLERHCSTINDSQHRLLLLGDLIIPKYTILKETS